MTSGSTSGSETTTLEVNWYEPDNTGRPPITGYDVQYKKTTDTGFADATHSGTNTTTAISGLDADTSYQVRVRAKNTDVTANEGPWSLLGAGSTTRKATAHRRSRPLARTRGAWLRTRHPDRGSAQR